MNKQINLLYFSPTDTTAKIVKEIGKGFGGTIKEYDVTLPGSRQQELVFGCNDLVIAGVPVYSGRVPDFLIDYFKKVRGNNTPAIFITVYGNRDYDDALLELKNTLEENGFIGIAGAAFIGEHSYTRKVATARPDAEDLKAALSFGAQVNDKLCALKEADLGKKLIVKGNFPYKEKKASPPMLPKTSDKCVKCGICAGHCPMGAIDFSNFKDIDASKCISCCSCIKRCASGAKFFHDERYDKLSGWLEYNFSNMRKEPELFI